MKGPHTFEEAAMHGPPDPVDPAQFDDLGVSWALSLVVSKALASVAAHHGNIFEQPFEAVSIFLGCFYNPVMLIVAVGQHFPSTAQNEGLWGLIFFNVSVFRS